MFGDVTGHEEVNAVPHDHSVFHAMTKLIDWDAFEAAVAEHGTVKARGFTDKSHLLTLLYAQFSDAHSLRHILAGLNSHAARLYRLGAAPVSRSTLADANRDRPAAVFSDLFSSMISRAHRGLRRVMDGATYLIDSTGSRLNAHSASWARFSATTCGVKTHVIYDATRIARSMPRSAPPTSTTSPRPMPCRSCPVPLTSLILATMTTPGGPDSTLRDAASSPG